MRRSLTKKGLAGCGAAAPRKMLAECEAEPHEERLGGSGAVAPKMAVGEKRRTMGYIYVTMVEINIFNIVIFQE